MNHSVMPTQTVGLGRVDAVLELRMAVQRAEACKASMPGGADHLALEDQRAACVSDLLDAIDRIDPGLGTRMLMAMYPGIRPGVFEDRRRPA